MTSNVEMREVETLFNNKGIAISCNNMWLRSCVECFRSQCNNYTRKELLDFVFEQWLLADLKEVRSSSLPRECTSHEKFMLTGKHAVQLNYALNVSASYYSQLQKIRKPDFDKNLDIDSERELEEKSYFHKTSERRSLKLEMCDGQLTVIGFEDRPIPCLRNPVPGEKALLKGPIECRKGVLMLTEKNIEILGGEVDTLLIPNAVGNVLARMLNQPQDPDPYRQRVEPVPDNPCRETLSNYLEEDDEALLLLAESMESETLPTNVQNQTSSNVFTNSVEYNSVNNDSLNFEDDDFDLVAAQTASLAEMEALKQQNDSKSRIRKRETENWESTSRASESVSQEKKTKINTLPSPSPDSVEYVDMNDPKRLKKELEKSYGAGVSQINPTPVETPTETLTAELLSPPQNTEESDDFDIDLSDPECTPKEPTETFHQPYPPRKFPALRVVHGRVVQLSEKLSVKNDQWSLAAIVSAKGLDLEMTFASEVLDKIFGITAAELMSRRKDLKSNPAAKEQVNRTLRESQLVIKNLDCEMVVRFTSVIAKPVIIDVIQK